MPIGVDYEMSVDAKGYRLERGRIIGQGGSKWRKQLNEKDCSTLFLLFAKVQTPEGLLDFVRKFGRLTKDKPDGPHGDEMRFVLDHADMMSKMLEMLRGHIGNLPRWKGGVVEYEAETPSLRVKVQGGIPLPGKLTAWLAPDPMTGAWQLKLQPPTLLDAIWLQFGQALTSNLVLRPCRGCDKWFEAGVGSGRRGDAQYCSDRCRVEHKSLERTRKKRSR
jgi:hypothetical protein